MVAAKIPFASRLPFLVVAIVLAVATICAVVVRLTERLPINPWEPAIAMEAVRLNAGLPLYESGHATHMYGPLLTLLLAGIFRIVGLNLLAARILFSIFAFLLTIFLVTVVCRGKSRECWLIAVLLFLGVNLRTNLIFLSAQPDCIAALIALVALYFWIPCTRSRLRPAAAIALFVSAVLFKQTSAAFALIPIVYVLAWERPLRFRDVAVSIVPTMSILLALAAVRLLWPQMFSAIVTVPASIKVYPERSFVLAVFLFAAFPIFFIALFSILRSKTRINERERWILSALVVLVPVSIWAASKSGGSYSSLLPAYLAMTALFVSQLDAITDWLRSLPIRLSILTASAIALAILFSFFIQFNRAAVLLYARCGDDKYDSAVGVAHELGRGTIAPQDPTIAYRANGYFGRSLFFELDTHTTNGNWPAELPIAIEEELARSAHVIEIKGYVPTPMFERALVANRFHPLANPALADSAYTVWARSSK